MGYSILRHREIPCNTCDLTTALSKGNEVDIPQAGIARFRGNTIKLGDAGMCNWKSSLFFLTAYLPEWIIQSKGYTVGRAVHHRIVSDVHNDP